MEKIWAGRSAGALDKYADELNSSIGVDKRMYKQDIQGSIAHAGMLAKCGIISPEEGAQLIEGLGGILDDISSGALQIDTAAEDIHSFVEAELTARLGDAEIDWGKSAVHRNGVETALTAKEFTLLRKLWDARGNIVTIDALCAALWDGPLVGYENTLMVHIRRLREKIEADPSHPNYLLTVRGLGYRLVREAAP